MTFLKISQNQSKIEQDYALQSFTLSWLWLKGWLMQIFVQSGSMMLLNIVDKDSWIPFVCLCIFRQSPYEGCVESEAPWIWRF